MFADGITNNYGWIQSVTTGGAYWKLALNPSGGDVGIGTTAPAYKLDVNGTTACTGNVWTSDKRKKKNITPYQISGLSIIQKLNPVSFQWKEVEDDGMEGIQLGFIAQEIEEILPNMVVTANDSMGSKAVKYTELFPVLVNAIKEQQVLIEALQQENTHLKTEAAHNEDFRAATNHRLQQLEEYLKTAQK